MLGLTPAVTPRIKAGFVSLVVKVPAWGFGRPAFNAKKVKDK